MIDKVIVSKDRTQAIIYFINKSCLTVYHDKGLVLDLVAWFMLPVGNTNHDITWDGLLASDENTDINMQLTGKVA